MHAWTSTWDALVRGRRIGAASARQATNRTPSFRRWIAATVLVPTIGAAQTGSTSTLSYAEAQQRFLERSDAIAASDAAVEAREAQQAATRSLRGPDVELEVQALEYQKTLDLPLGSLAPVAGAFGIPNPLRFRDRRYLTRPIVTATLPLYTGGQIGAAQAGAAAQLAVAEADRESTMAQGLLGLARTYFGRQLAAQALDVRRQVVLGIARHVDDARALEREQQIARVQRLQAEASLEEAEREADKAEADLAAADAALAGLLRSDAAIAPTTPLAVSSMPLPPVARFASTARRDHPNVRRLEASGALAEAAVRAEEAKRRPTIYALGQYNFDRDDALFTDPDFIVGIGIRYKLLSGSDRRSQVNAAKATAMQAERGLREAQAQLETGVTVAWTRAESARRRHALYARAIAAAEESLRVARLSFRELQGTSRDVTDAELSLGRVRVEQARAAYEYVDSLAQLLDVSGRIFRLPEFVDAAAVSP
jgi:outer membrane protein TolC